eukprot:jgi/Botrbrau1/21149/Bobra.0061s0043.1
MRQPSVAISSVPSLNNNCLNFQTYFVVLHLTHAWSCIYRTRGLAFIVCYGNQRKSI